jgi:hypothetical protein
MKETLTLELGRIHGNTGPRADWNLSGLAEYTPGFVQRSHLETGTRGPDRPLIVSERNELHPSLLMVELFHLNS